MAAVYKLRIALEASPSKPDFSMRYQTGKTPITPDLDLLL
jgi:hypothetical protein